MSPGGDPPGGGDKPPGLELFNDIEVLIKRVLELKKHGYKRFEFVLAKYDEKD